MRILVIIAWALLLSPMGFASTFLLNAPEGLLSMKKQEGAVYLLVQGLELKGEATQWERELYRLQGTGRSVHFYKWSKRKKIEQNVQGLVSAIEQLRFANPTKKITIVGYSAGGVLSMLALDEIMQKKIDKTIFLHIVASPLFGYSAPKFAPSIGFFIGSTALSVGKGILKTSDQVKERFYCRHWINTDCVKDNHACRVDEIFPMTGIQGHGLLPCRGDSVVEMEEDHSVILTKALAEIAP